MDELVELVELDVDGCTSTVNGLGCDTVIVEGLTPAATAIAFFKESNDPDKLDDEDKLVERVETISFDDDVLFILYSTSVAILANLRIIVKASKRTVTD
jgi:hypothetical protein